MQRALRRLRLNELHMQPRGRAFFILTTVAVLLQPGSSAADPPATVAPSANASAPAGPASSVDAAKENFDVAQGLFDKKKYEPALVLFRQAYEQSKSPNARLMIGLCLLKQGRIAEAYDELRGTLIEAAAKAESESKYIQTRDAAAVEIAPLEAKVGRLVLTFSGSHPGARVKVNGVEVLEARFGTPLAVLPGTVEIVVEGMGSQVQNRTETVSAGQMKTVVLDGASGLKTDASTKAKALPGGSTTSPDGTPTTSTGGGVRKAGFVVGGLGAVGMVVFGVAAAIGESKLNQLKEECGGVRCTDPKYADVVESGKTFDLLANVSLGVGIAGIVAGGAMIVFGGPKKAEVTTAATFHFAPGGAVFGYKGAF